MARLGRWDSLVSPLGHAATTRHREAFQLYVGGIGPALYPSFGLNSQNAVKGGAEIQVIFDEHRSGLPRRLQWFLAAQSTDEVLALSEVPRAMRPRDLQFPNIVLGDLRRVTEVPTSLVRAGQ